MNKSGENVNFLMTGSRLNQQEWEKSLTQIQNHLLYNPIKERRKEGGAGLACWMGSTLWSHRRAAAGYGGDGGARPELAINEQLQGMKELD
jgi:hypothetical protein